MTNDKERESSSELPELDGVPLTMDSLEQVTDEDTDEFGVTAVEDGVENPFVEDDNKAPVSDLEGSEKAVGKEDTNPAQKGVQEPEEGFEQALGEDFTRFLVEEYGSDEEDDAAAGFSLEDEVEEVESEEETLDYFDSIDPEDWGLLGWRVDPSRDDDGKVLKGEAARANPASLILESDDGETVHSILLTPQVRQDLHAALTQLGTIYADPVPVSKKAKDRLDRVVQWHLEHKVLGGVSALFILAFITFVIIGFTTVN